MNKNYYENLKQDYNTIKQLFEIADAERDGVIPKIAGPVLCYVSKDALKSKPKDDAVFRKLRGRYSYIHYPGGETLRNNWSIEELKKYIENGHSIQIGHFRDHDAAIDGRYTFKGAQLISANMIAVDIDTKEEDAVKPTIESILNESKPYRPTMIYETLSHRPDNPRYRVVFLLDRIVNPLEFKTITEYFINKFSKADNACKDLVRLYLGGKNVPFFEGNFLKVDEILETTEASMIRLRLEKGKGRQTRVRMGKVIEEKLEVNNTAISLNLKEIAKNYDVKTLEFMQAIEFVNNLPLDKIIGVELGDIFRCVMPDHMDNNPSSIILEIDGKQRYKCHGCSDVRTKSVIDTLMPLLKMDYKQTVEYILSEIGIGFDTTYQWEARAIIQFNRILLTKNQDTELYKKLKRANLLGTYIAFTNYMENYIPESPIIEGEISMFVSLSHLSETFKGWGMKGTDISSISRKMRDLVSYGLLTKVKHKDLPEALRNKSNEMKAQAKTKYAITYWAIPKLSDEILEYAMQKTKKEKGVGYTKKHLNKTQMMNLHGKEEAEIVYNQDDVKRSRLVYAKLKELAVKFIDKQGYFTRQEIIDHTDIFDKKVYQYLPGIANDMNLEYKVINKELKEQLSIDLPRGSRVYIVKKD